MVLTDRDYEILRFLLEQGFASGLQLKRRFWKDISKQLAYRRFKLFEKNRYIEVVKLGSMYPAVYILSRKGYRMLKSRGLNSGLSFYPYFDMRDFYHDLCLVNIRITFYELGIEGWLSERQLRTQSHKRRGLIPDGLLLHRNDAKVAIELELNRKKKVRYERIFGDYDRAFDIDAVFYFVGNQELRSILIHLSRDFTKIFYCLYEEFLTKREETPFQSKGEKFALKEVL